MAKKVSEKPEVVESLIGMIGAIVSLLVEFIEEFGGNFSECLCHLGTAQGKSTLREIAKLIVAEANGSENEFFKLISGDEDIVIDAVDGTEVLADASDMFASIDSDFRNWKADELGSPTNKTPVRVYEMVKNANFTQMFGSLSADISRLCLTQAQIKRFVKQHRDWIKTDGYVTFFLFKSHEQFFVAVVSFDSVGRLGVRVVRFEGAGVWCAEGRHRLAAPQLA